MSSPTLSQRLRYRFDTFMARGGSAIFMTLVTAFLSLLGLFTLLRAALLAVYPGETAPNIGDGLLQNIYVIFLEMTAPGNMNQDLLSSGHFKLAAMAAGLTGVILLSMLIGLITTSLQAKIDALKKGHSKVIEEDHTLILGWNSRVLEILRELVIANESEPDACVVILADEDKEEMDDHLSVHLGPTRTTRVVTRSGAVSTRANLEIASLETCRAVIVLGHCADAADAQQKLASDAQVIKTILGVTTAHPDGQAVNIVAELFDARSREIASKISPSVSCVDAQEILSKILVQTSRSVGLSVVYSEILSFDGCEMYFHGAAWGGRTFGAVQYHFADGVPMGVRTPAGEVLLNPAADRVMQDGDEVLILAEDDSTIEFRAAPVAAAEALPLADKRARQRLERELLIGYGPLVPGVLREYADYLLEGSQIDLLLPAVPDPVRAEVEALAAELPGLKLGLIEADPLDTEALAKVRPFSYDNVVVIGQGAGGPAETLDSETIVLLLLLRQIYDAEMLNSSTTETKIISEILDSRNQDLVTRAGVHDFIISNRFVSMLLAQISEEPDIRRVYDDLFSEDGSEIYLKRAGLYLDELPRTLTFADMMGLAQRRDEVCLGVKVYSQEKDPDANFGVRLIPPKTERFELGPRDCFIVLAEDET